MTARVLRFGDVIRVHAPPDYRRWMVIGHDFDRMVVRTLFLTTDHWDHTVAEWTYQVIDEAMVLEHPVGFLRD